MREPINLIAAMVCATAASVSIITDRPLIVALAAFLSGVNVMMFLHPQQNKEGKSE